MKKLLSYFLFVFICFLLSGCMDHAKMINKFLPKSIDDFARESIQLAKSKDINNILARLDESIKNEQTKNSLIEMFDYMDKGEILEIVTTGVHVNKFNENTTYNISYQLKYPNNFQIVNLVLFDASKGVFIKGFHINDISDSLDNLNKFTFKGKSLTHFIFFALNVFYIIFIISAFIVCLKTKNLNKKWLWAIISFLGIGEVLFNWATGAWNLKLFSIGFNISSFIPPTPYMASILKFYIPIGAIAFFIKRSTLKKYKAKEV